MLRYETLFLTRTELSEDDASTLEKQLDKIVSEAQGKLDSFDKWGKYKLAYPVKKQGNGMYILARYQAPTAYVAKLLHELDQFLKLKCSETVLRHVNIRLRKNAPATYIKPDSVDLVRTGSLDTFFKDNKIENLLNTVEPSGAKGKVNEDVDFDDTNIDMDEQA